MNIIYNMENVIPVLFAASIPAILVSLTAYIVLAKNLKADEKRRDTELLLASKHITLPMRMQAYERLILLLERISPDGMLMRLKGQAQTNADLHLAMLQSIRSEYEHNLSQQLYVSLDVWEKVKQAKESVVTFINDCAKGTNPAAPSIELSKKIFDGLVNQEETTVPEVLNDLKREAQRYL